MCHKTLIATAGLLAASITLHAQSTGTFVGLVTDSQGSVIPGVIISADNVFTNFHATATTNATGNFLISSLPVGQYRLSAMIRGFQTKVQEGIRLQIDQKLTVNFTLEVAGVSEKVVVEAPPVLLETTTSTLSQVVDTRRINDLPLNGRNVLSLLGLQAGVSTRGGSLSYANAYLYPVNSGYNFDNSINGARGNQTGYKLDGGTNTDGTHGIADPFPNPDAVQEFSVQTNNFSAENGGMVGGVVNVVTKSGTNQLHGSLFEFHRNDFLNARNFFSPSADPLKRNQFGASAGGPVTIPHLYNGRDKTFFFFSYQGTRNRRALSAATFTAFSTPQQGGDLSGTAIAKDPDSGQAFAGNVIPKSRFDPAIAKLLAYMPAANQGSSVLRFAQPPQVIDDNQYVLRMDQALHGSDQLTGRWMHVNFQNPQSYVPGNLYSAVAGILSTTDNAMVSYTHIIRPNLLNVARFTYLNLSLIAVPAVDLAVADLGAHVPKTTPGNLSVSIAGYSSLSNGFNNISYDRNFEWADDVNYSFGRHTIRFGAKVLSNIKQSGGAFQSSGAYAFSGQITGNTLADFLLGLPTTFTMRQVFTQHVTSTKPSLYIQDDLRLTSYFTVNLGMRWDPDVPYIDSIDMWPAFRPGVQSQRFVNAPAGLVFANDAGVPRGVTTPDWNNFAPRIGFAWNPHGGATVVRGAYGIFYDQMLAQFAWRSAEPYVASTTIFAPPSFVNPYGSGTPTDPNQNLSPSRDHIFTPNITFGSLEPHFGSAVIQSTNLTVERRVAKTMLLRGSYVGTFGTHLLASESVNPAVYVPNASTVANTNARRYYPQFGEIWEVRNGSRSWYHSAQFSVQKQFSNALMFNANYTLSKSIDTASFGEGAGVTSGPNPFNLRSNRGLSDYDATQHVNASFLWNLPLWAHSKGLAGKLLAGWEINAMIYVQSGTPFSITDTRDQGFAGIGNGVRADLVGNPILSGGRSLQNTISQYFDPSAFALPGNGFFGTSGRNILRGPGYADVDSALLKDFAVHERCKLQFRAEAFNLLNRVNLGNPTAVLSSPNLGHILSANTPRILQLALKLIY